MTELDWQGITEGLQRDNELLREELARLKLNPPKWWQSFSVQDLQEIIQDNFFWAGVGVTLLLTAALALMLMLRGKS